MINIFFTKTKQRRQRNICCESGKFYF